MANLTIAVNLQRTEWYFLEKFNFSLFELINS